MCSLSRKNKGKEGAKRIRTKKNKRIEEAQKKTLEIMDYILEVREAPNFIEITGCTGGDARMFRFYDDGMVTER